MKRWFSNHPSAVSVLSLVVITVSLAIVCFPSQVQCNRPHYKQNRRQDAINDWIRTIKSSPKSHSLSPSWSGATPYEVIGVSSLPLQNEAGSDYKFPKKNKKSPFGASLTPESRSRKLPPSRRFPAPKKQHEDSEFKRSSKQPSLKDTFRHKQSSGGGGFPSESNRRRPVQSQQQHPQHSEEPYGSGPRRRPPGGLGHQPRRVGPGGGGYPRRAPQGRQGPGGERPAGLGLRLHRPHQQKQNPAHHQKHQQHQHLQHKQQLQKKVQDFEERLERQKAATQNKRPERPDYQEFEEVRKDTRPERQAPKRPEYADYEEQRRPEAVEIRADPELEFTRRERPDAPNSKSPMFMKDVVRPPPSASGPGSAPEPYDSKNPFAGLKYEKEKPATDAFSEFGPNPFRQEENKDFPVQSFEGRTRVKPNLAAIHRPRRRGPPPPQHSRPPPIQSSPDLEGNLANIPRFDISGLRRPDPVFDRPDPVFKRPDPVFERPEPVFERPEPVFERPEPVFDRPRGNPFKDQPRLGHNDISPPREKVPASFPQEDEIEHGFKPFFKPSEQFLKGAGRGEGGPTGFGAAEDDDEPSYKLFGDGDNPLNSGPIVEVDKVELPSPPRMRYPQQRPFTTTPRPIPTPGPGDFPAPPPRRPRPPPTHPTHPPMITHPPSHYKPRFEAPSRPRFEESSRPRFEESSRPNFEEPSRPSFEEPSSGRPRYGEPSNSPRFDGPSQPRFEIPDQRDYEEEVNIPRFNPVGADQPRRQFFEKPEDEGDFYSQEKEQSENERRGLNSNPFKSEDRADPFSRSEASGNGEEGFFAIPETFPNLASLGGGFESMRIRNKRSADPEPEHAAEIYQGRAEARRIVGRRQPARPRRLAGQESFRNQHRRQGDFGFQPGFWEDVETDFFAQSGPPFGQRNQPYRRGNSYRNEGSLGNSGGNQYSSHKSTPERFPKPPPAVSSHQSSHRSRGQDPYPQSSVQTYPVNDYNRNSYPGYDNKDNEILGSGNFEVIKGGTFYDADTYYNTRYNSRPQNYYGGDFFENFRDFADIKSDLYRNNRYY